MIEKHEQFPTLTQSVNGNTLTYLDNAGTTLMHQSVLESMQKFELEARANPHSGIHTLSVRAHKAVQGARETVAQFIGAQESSEIVFTKNTTESLNLVAYSWALENVQKEDNIVVSELEHHSNILPWKMVAEKTGATLQWIKITNEGFIDIAHAQTIINSNTKLVALNHVSNVTGAVNDIKPIIKHAHKQGAVVVVDGAQAVAHIPVDVQDLDADCYAFSAHKMYGPMGVGVLYAKRVLLDTMSPFIVGGGTVSVTTKEYTHWLSSPEKFEGGTLNGAGIVGLGQSIEYFLHEGFDAIQKHEHIITTYALEQLQKVDGLTIYGTDTEQRIGVISFTVEGVHPHDVASLLDEKGIAIRAGHHCCGPLMEVLEVDATCRVSFGMYNSKSDIDVLIEVLTSIKEKFS